MKSPRPFSSRSSEESQAVGESLAVGESQAVGEPQVVDASQSVEESHSKVPVITIDSITTMPLGEGDLPLRALVRNRHAPQAAPQAVPLVKRSKSGSVEFDAKSLAESVVQQVLGDKRSVTLRITGIESMNSAHDPLPQSPVAVATVEGPDFDHLIRLNMGDWEVIASQPAAPPSASTRRDRSRSPRGSVF